MLSFPALCAELFLPSTSSRHESGADDYRERAIRADEGMPIRVTMTLACFIRVLNFVLMDCHINLPIGEGHTLGSLLRLGTPLERK
ncbi:hypothetical protein CDAR_559311 [Caerostris darwini]|uniref:Uncharacterized protein n=1 Tax=Caerostris darwini TaxID=1538125 RepID=A0AAV4P0U6_9ARAC|nr:hypothetical protein CDAR_559311 [Caerostris darwini]